MHMNHLHLKQFVLLAALRANAELIGLSLEQLVDSRTVSPFFVGGGSSMSASDSCSSFSASPSPMPFAESLKPDLRPIQIQFTHRHHPYMDLFPCPVFRQRLIDAVTADPPLIDQREFCRDLERNGIICWGSHTDGVDPTATGSGTPWDIRSWEMEPWFLRKWHFLVGDEEGGAFLSQSRWWREMRGEDSDVLTQ